MRALWTHHRWKRNETGPGDWIGPHSTPFLGQDLPIAAQHAAMARLARSTRVLSAATVCQGSRCSRLDSPPMGSRRWFEVAAGSQPLVWVCVPEKSRFARGSRGFRPPWCVILSRRRSKPSRHASQCGRWTGQRTGRCRPENHPPPSPCRHSLLASLLLTTNASRYICISHSWCSAAAILLHPFRSFKSHTARPLTRPPSSPPSLSLSQITRV